MLFIDLLPSSSFAQVSDTVNSFLLKCANLLSRGNRYTSCFSVLDFFVVLAYLAGLGVLDVLVH